MGFQSKIQSIDGQVDFSNSGCTTLRMVHCWFVATHRNSTNAKEGGMLVLILGDFY